MQFPIPAAVSRRQALRQAGAGFGMLGLAGMLNPAGALQAATTASATSFPNYIPRAKRVIFLFMNGAPSHVDTFDPKPALAEHEGEQPEGIKSKGSGFMPSPFSFSPHGESGVVMSELFPNLAQHADDVCVIRSMHTDVPNHEPGLLLMNCGHQQPVRPCLGSWASYGLGSENRNLPNFVVLTPGMPVVGPQLWSNSFLPGQHQATSVNTSDLDIERLVANIRHPSLSRTEQRRQLDLLLELNRRHQRERENDAALEEQIRAMELAFEMQREAAEAFDVSKEPKHIRELYGSSDFGQGCLLARRLAERGVRFIQVYYVSKKNKQPWDTHANNNEGHRTLCADSDRATAALISDLRARGLLEDTLIVWGGEFGRTPYSQMDQSKMDVKKAGRDHHNTGFSMLLAGGGVKGGYTHGATDELGMHAVEKRVHVHDLHATILHLLGIDHEKLTYHYSGRDFRLTGCAWTVVQDIVA